MSCRVIFAVAMVMFGIPGLTYAGAKEDVAATVKTWADGMNSHSKERVLALYDQEAVLWGTRSPTLRDNPTAVREYFKILDKVPPSYNVVIDEQRIRVYGDVAIDTGRYTFSEIRDDKPLVRPARFSFVLLNRNGHWMIVDHHSSAVPSS